MEDYRAVRCPYCFSSSISVPDSRETCRCWDCGKVFPVDHAAFEPAEDQRQRGLGAAGLPGLEGEDE